MTETMNIDAKEIVKLLQKGNFSQAEIFSRLVLDKQPGNPVALNFLGLISQAVNLPQAAMDYFELAARSDPDWSAPKTNIARLGEYLKRSEAATSAVYPRNDGKQRFLLIKAWGYGFWADVDHVLGQLLMAEITNRIPVIHWGSNSLFGDGTGANAFNLYFYPISDFTLEDLRSDDGDYFPPKWNQYNLDQDDVNKWEGVGARMAWLHYLSRPEKVAVSDFHSNISSIKPWVPKDHHLYRFSVDMLYRYLVKRYLRPRKEILNDIDEFYSARLSSDNFMSVHVRGSDKIGEIDTLERINEEYYGIIDRYLDNWKDCRIFLMTDDMRLLNSFVDRYGSIIVTTDCQRTCSSAGIHNDESANKRGLGVEVMVDTYLAVKARVFIGNGHSNVSRMVYHLKAWDETNIHLIGGKMHHDLNTVLYDW